MNEQKDDVDNKTVKLESTLKYESKLLVEDEAEKKNQRKNDKGKARGNERFEWLR